MSVNIKPLEDRILVKTLEAEQTTASGLVIPDTAKEKPQEGEVIAVGPGRVNDDGDERVPLDISVRDRPAFHALVMRRRVTRDEIATALAESLPTVFGYAQRHGLAGVVQQLHSVPGQGPAAGSQPLRIVDQVLGLARVREQVVGLGQVGLAAVLRADLDSLDDRRAGEHALADEAEVLAGFDLRRWRRQAVGLHKDYRLRAWSDDLIQQHAEVKYQSFREELDALALKSQKNAARAIEEGILVVAASGNDSTESNAMPVAIPEASGNAPFSRHRKYALSASSRVTLVPANPAECVSIGVM